MEAKSRHLAVNGVERFCESDRMSEPEGPVQPHPLLPTAMRSCREKRATRPQSWIRTQAHWCRAVGRDLSPRLPRFSAAGLPALLPSF